MMRKNKISVLLLAAVMMLSVYYLKVRNASDAIEVDFVEEVASIKDSRLVTTRTQINEHRETQLEELRLVLGSETSIETIEETQATINEINSIISKEIALELEIMALGFDDALVHAYDNEVSVTVISTEESVDIVNNFFEKSKEMFGDYYAVKVGFLLPL